MDKYIINQKKRAESHIQGTDFKRVVNFPLCLSVKYKNDVPYECADFLLNTSKGKVFIKTDAPLPEGSDVVLHFYIPPNSKLLSEVKGKVISDQNPRTHVRGNYIKIHDLFHRKIHKLEDYLEEKKHLIDERV